MSSVLIHSFSILIAVYFVVLTIFCALWSFMSGTHPIVLSILFILLVLIFLMGSALSLIFFIQTLNKLVEARELALAGNVMRTNHLRRRDFKLDSQQQAFANLSAKYVMLFIIAVVTTIFTQITALSVNFSSGLRSTICALNLCIVLWCLYLQFTFAKDHYQKSCGCCDTRCTSAISRKSQRRIHEQVMSMMHGRLSNSNTPRSRSTPRSVSSQTGSPRSHIRMVSDDLTVNLDWRGCDIDHWATALMLIWEWILTETALERAHSLKLHGKLSCNFAVLLFVVASRVHVNFTVFTWNRKESPVHWNRSWIGTQFYIEIYCWNF